MSTLKLKSIQISYLLPILVIAASILLGLSPLIHQYPELAIAITYDLTLTAPLLFLLLSRKSNISKLRALPIFTIGLIIASYLLPASGQQHLGYIKTFLLPLVEITILVILIRKIYFGIKTYKTNAESTADFIRISKKSSHEVFGKSKFGAFFSSEISMLYYALFSWKKVNLKSNEFTNFKESGSIALAGALLMVVFVETFAFHVLLLKWNYWAAWILTATSIYTALMIIGHIKALLHRPSVLTKSELLIKNGLLADIKIDLNAIENITIRTKEMQSKELKIGNLGLSKESTNHNIAIHFNTPQTIEKMYGFTEECDVLLMHIDSKQDFIEKVNSNLSKISN